MPHTPAAGGTIPQHLTWQHARFAQDAELRLQRLLEVLPAQELVVEMLLQFVCQLAEIPAATRRVEQGLEKPCP